MSTHSSVLAWRIPWTEEPGGLQSMGSRELDTTERLTVSLSPSVNRKTLVIFKILYKILTMYTRNELQGTP